MCAQESPLRICLVAPKAYPLFNPEAAGVLGGAEVDLYYLATELARDTNFEVSFLCADYGQSAEEVWEGVRVLRTVDFKRNPLHGAWRIWQGLRRARAQIYMIKTISLGMFLVALFCRGHRRRFAFRTSNRGSCDGTYVKRHLLMGWLYRRALRGASLIFVQNREDVAELRRTVGVTAQAIPNGHRAVPEVHDRTREVVIWVGRSVAIKGPERFLDLAEAVPEQRFEMVCQRATGDTDYGRLVDRAATLDHLVFHEGIPFDRIHDLFARARVLVNTSDAEGFPNTFIEACQHGVPILSLSVNPDGFLDAHDCGLCCQGASEELPRALRELLVEARREQAGANARQYAETNHSVERIAAQYKTCFREIIPQPG